MTDDWTPNLVKAHFDSRFEDFNRALVSALQSVEKATMLAHEASEKRLDAMNEFRSALLDQTKQYITRREYDARHQQLEDRIESLNGMISKLMGGVVFASFAIPILMYFFFDHKIEAK